MRATADSPAFRKAPAVRALFLYLWEHRGQPLGEYRIATECLGKASDFDPKLDASVRVHISRLRQKLKEQAEPRISLPQGSYRLEIAAAPLAAAILAPPVETEAAQSVAVAAPPRKPGALTIALGAAAAILAVACLALLWENRRLGRELQAPPARLQRFWTDFFRNGKPTTVILPTPVFFEWKDNPLKVRDTRINDFAQHSASPLLQPLVGRFGAPMLMQNYTVVSDTFAAVKLAQYLQSRGVQVSFGGTSDFSFDQFGDRNVVLIGLSSSSFHIRRFMERTNFYSNPAQASTIMSRKPGTGEAAEYKMVQQSGSRRSVPGMVGVLPGPAPNTKVLMVAGWASSALISFLTAEPSLEQLDAAWADAGSPEFFELLVQSEIEGNAVLRAETLGLRPFRGAAPAMAAH